MEVAKNRVVSIHFEMQDEQENLLQSTASGDPMAYLHGHNNLFEPLEKALDGKSIGDEVSATLSADEAYGPRRDIPLQRIAIKRLKGARKWRPGMVAVVDTEQGQREVTLVKVGKFNADCDLNHPFAGKSLSFNIKIHDIRDASAEEIRHGHAHGVGGHQH